MSRFEDPVIISCSISGAIANREQCPAIPYTPEEYAAEARRAVDEGASQIHIHARTPEGVPSYEIEDFQAITEAIRSEVGDVIINYSTGAIGVSLEKRIAYLEALKPDVAALNMSSMNYAKYSRRRKDFVFKTVFENSFDTIIELIEAMKANGIQPEHECFDAGHVANLDSLIDMGLLEPPLQISLVMGVTGGIRPVPRNVTAMSDQIPGGPEGPNNWQVIGVSRDQWKLLASSLVLGGNVRAGLEDNLYLPNGEMAGSNGDLIGKARQMAEDVGRRAATVAEARPPKPKETDPRPRYWAGPKAAGQLLSKIEGYAQDQFGNQLYRYGDCPYFESSKCRRAITLELARACSPIGEVRLPPRGTSRSSTRRGVKVTTYRTARGKLAGTTLRTGLVRVGIGRSMLDVEELEGKAITLADHLALIDALRPVGKALDPGSALPPPALAKCRAGTRK